MRKSILNWAYRSNVTVLNYFYECVLANVRHCSCDLSPFQEWNVYSILMCSSHLV